MPKIAILIPCYNEERTIGNVIHEFKAQLPDAAIYVYDNNSTDNSVRASEQAGAIVRHENRQGKGFVIRTMFQQIEAEVYVMVDGDGTYPAQRVHDLIGPVLRGEADMVVGSRLHAHSKSTFKLINNIGNKLFLFILNSIFRMNVTDVLSGYRAFSRNLVKSLPVLSRGFEIETELTVKCFDRGYRMLEFPVNLSPRPEGSESKIRIFRDGVLILNTIFSLFRDYKPFTAFGTVGLLLIICGLVPGVAVVVEFISTGLVSKVPSAILAVGLVLIGALSMFVGLILHSISRHFKEQDYLLQNIINATGDTKKQ
jgi:glycosyltransferase involved in cell wall biosynthesis